jgi:hypothetical protein
MGGPTSLNISDKWMIAGVPCELRALLITIYLN